MGQVVAGFVAVGTLVVVASIVYQVVNGKHSIGLAKIGGGVVTSVTGTLFKS